VHTNEETEFISQFTEPQAFVDAGYRLGEPKKRATVWNVAKKLQQVSQEKPGPRKKQITSTTSSRAQNVPV